MSEKKEYIERGALKDKFRIPDRESVFNLVIAETPTIEAANIATDMIIEIAGALRDAVDDEPAADVEPVVRCKDCKYGKVPTLNGHLIKNGCRQCIHRSLDLHCQSHPEDWYCPKGERKDGDAHG